MADQLVGLIRPGVEVWAAGLETGREKLRTPDTCVKAQSPFDRCARVGLPQQETEVQIPTYLAFLTTQVMDWSAAEFQALQRIIPSLRPAFEPLEYNLPDKVWLIQTSGREEAAAAYTKHHDTIVLPANFVASVQPEDKGGDPLHPGFTDDFLAGVITHEFFHLLSKNNPDARKGWYETVSYQELPNEIELPGDVIWWNEKDRPFSMAALKITNPDAPLINVAIMLPPKAGAKEVLMAPALISSTPYVGGQFFDTLEWIFLEVELQDGQADLKRGEDGKPVIYKAADVMSAYREKIGYYLSGELFHPDELLAQSFAKAATQFQPPLLEKIAKSIWPGWPT
jgi:hypothetical protein